MQRGTHGCWFMQWRGVSRRTWTVNGAITPEKRSSYFYTDVKKQNEELLLPGIERGSYIMLHAPRASGKSTRMEAAVEQLQGTGQYEVLTTSFQSGVDFETKEKLGTSFWVSLGRKNTVCSVACIVSSADFASAF